MLEQPEFCDLRVTGVTRTLAAVHGWAKEVASDARAHMRGRINAHIWAYRNNGHQVLSCDLTDETGKRYLVTITGGGSQYFHTRMGMEAEALVKDLAEAVHTAGMITRMLNASITIGMHGSEENADILASGLSEGQVFGPMALTLIGHRT